jgi:hypothetical protein
MEYLQEVGEDQYINTPYTASLVRPERKAGIDIMSVFRTMCLPPR